MDHTGNTICLLCIRYQRHAHKLSMCCHDPSHAIDIVSIHYQYAMNLLWINYQCRQFGVHNVAICYKPAIHERPTCYEFATASPACFIHEIRISDWNAIDMLLISIIHYGNAMKTISTPALTIERLSYQCVIKMRPLCYHCAIIKLIIAHSAQLTTG